jgi:hypothetical protein
MDYPEPQKQYGHLINGVYRHIYPNRASVSMCGSEPIVEVLITALEDVPLDADKGEFHYIAWVPADEKPQFRLIQSSLIAFGIQFPYGWQVSQKHGRGKAVYVDIKLVDIKEEGAK